MQSDFHKKILQFDKPVPRYTSYPTAPQFKAIDNDFNPYNGLDNKDPISLYIHIPFCPKLCWYCGCNTKITKKYDPVENYVDLLLKEISLVSKSLKSRIEIGHVHFGGGSPGILSPDDFEKIMTALKSHFIFTNNIEIAMEIDPREVTIDRVKTYAKCGVNRISLGTQDFDDKVLESVNRQQPFELSFNAINLFRDNGINNFNLDLIYGLPHQTIETMKSTMELALLLNPNRVSLFGYAHVPWMKKHMRLIDEGTLPNRDLRLQLFSTGENILLQSGYTSIGIDHFAQIDDTMTIALNNHELHRDFQGYTTDKSQNMIGLGSSSIGKINNQYLQNHVDMPAYKSAVENAKLPISKSCNITNRDKIHGKIIEQLMCYFEVDLNQYKGDFDNILISLNDYVESGFITITNQIIKIDKQAKPIARLVCAAFDDYLPSKQVKKHSQAI